MRSSKILKRLRIRHGIRSKIKGTATRPRLAVFKSHRNIYAQIIDDTQGHTLVCSSSQQIGAKDKNHCSISEQVGKHIGEKALKQNIKQVTFDRGGWPYHGKLKALADGARAAGLSF